MQKQQNTVEAEPDPFHRISRKVRRIQLPFAVVYCIILIVASAYHEKLRPNVIFGNETTDFYREASAMIVERTATLPTFDLHAPLEQVRTARDQWDQSYKELCVTLVHRFDMLLSGMETFWISALLSLMVLFLYFAGSIVLFFSWLNQIQWQMAKSISFGSLTMLMLILFPIVGMFFFDTILFSHNVCSELKRVHEIHHRAIARWVEWFYVLPTASRHTMSEFSCPFRVMGVSIDTLQLQNILFFVIILAPKSLHWVYSFLLRQRETREKKNKWQERNFQETINVSLNRITPDGVLLFRTLFEEKLLKLLESHLHAVGTVHDAMR